MSWDSHCLSGPLWLICTVWQNALDSCLCTQLAAPGRWDGVPAGEGFHSLGSEHQNKMAVLDLLNCSLLLIPQCLFLISLTLCFSHWSFELCSSQLTRVPSVSGPQWTSHAAFALHLWPLFHTVSLWTWRKLTRTFSVRYFAPDISTMGMGWSFQHAVACEECRLQDRPCCMAGLPAWRCQTVRKAGLQHEHLLREGWTGTQRHPSLMNELVKAAPLLTHNLHERFRTPF